MLSNAGSMMSKNPITHEASSTTSVRCGRLQGRVLESYLVPKKTEEREDYSWNLTNHGLGCLCGSNFGFFPYTFH